jgi:hypothetical protein
MIFKPHAFTRRASTEEVNAELVVAGVRYGAATAYTGQITPESPSRVFEDWGVELQRPHLLLVDLADGQSWEPGDLITYGSRNFKISAPVRIFDSGGIVASADHCAMIMEELQYAVTL